MIKKICYTDPETGEGKCYTVGEDGLENVHERIEDHYSYWLLYFEGGRELKVFKPTLIEEEPLTL